MDYKKYAVMAAVALAAVAIANRVDALRKIVNNTAA